MLTTSQALTRAMQHHRAGEFEPAEKLYRAVLRIDPSLSGVHYNLGSVLQKGNRLDEAIEAYHRALEIDPQDSTSHRALGTAFKACHKLAEAAECFRRALVLRPDYAEAHNNLGNTLHELGDLAAAIESYQCAVRSQPEFAGFHFNLANALLHEGRFAEAEESFRVAAKLNPRDAEVFNSLGISLFDQGRVTDAIASFESAIRLQPEHARSHYNQALAWLVSGDWERGWAEYEWRWKIREQHQPPTLRPRWTGCELLNKSLLVEAEQGLGDTIQFLRFVPVARQRVGRLVVRCPRQLIQLLEGIPGIDEVFADDDPPTSCDVWSPLLSLPNLLGTRLTNIPPAPYLAARPLLVERWRRELEGLTGFRIGIQWQGNPTHAKDRFRSFSLQQFKTMANLPGIHLVSLQKGAGAEQLQAIDFPVQDLGTRLDETSGAFLETAAVMQNLDLIITTDTSIGHLAGALGRPTWILLSTVPEWRWLLDRDDSPWYSTVRLFRQSRLGDWCEVFARLHACLQSMIATNSPQQRREAG